jgi:hypothetical protein
VLNSSKHMSADEVELCRDKIAEQLSEQLAERQATRAPRDPLTTLESEPEQNLQSLAGSDVETFITDNGTAQNVNNTLSVLGGANSQTFGDGSTLIIDSTPPGGGLNFDADMGDAQPTTAGMLTISGGTGVTTNATGPNTITINGSDLTFQTDDRDAVSMNGAINDVG